MIVRRLELWGLWVSVLVGCGRGATPEECKKMLDRYVEMTAPSDAPPTRALSPAYRQAEAQCAREVTRKEYACAMSAKTPNDWEACIE